MIFLTVSPTPMVGHRPPSDTAGSKIVMYLLFAKQPVMDGTHFIK